MIEFGDIFTCNTARSLLFAQDLWGPYPTALAEGKPPPEPPPDSTGAAYSARKTLTIMSQTFDERFGQASRGIDDQQPLWTGPSDNFLSEIGGYFILVHTTISRRGPRQTARLLDTSTDASWQ